MAANNPGPVGSSALNNILEKCFSQRIEVNMLIDYLEGMVHHRSTSRQSKLSKFVKKWKDSFSGSAKKAAVIMYSGIWVPNCVESRTATQQTWQDFVKTYDPTYDESEIINSYTNFHYQPLNFKELIHLSFWKELYETFGHQIVSHIFDKSAIIYEIEQSLFLMVAYPGGMMFQKMKKYESSLQQSKPKRLRLNLPSNSTLNIRRNPYEATRELGENVTLEKTKKENSEDLKSKKPKRKCNEDISLFSYTSANKKRKLVSTSASENVSSMQQGSLTNETDDAILINKPIRPLRWLKPKPNDLKKLIEHRNLLFNTYNASSSSKLSSEQSAVDSASLNYILIQKDCEFNAKDKLFIIKQTKALSPTTPKIPPQWVGLKLPENLKEIASGNKSIRLNVYIISETLAKHLGIRINRKGRCRKGRSAQKPIGDKEITEESPAQMKTNSDLPAPKPITIKNVENTIILQPCFVKESELNPFVATVLLPISPCLYNRTAWSKWSIEDNIIKAALIHPNDKVMSVRVLANGIMQKPICSKGSYQHLLRIIEGAWPDPSDTEFPLNKAFANVIEAHSKYKSIHRLVKSCCRYWKGKSKEKTVRKQGILSKSVGQLKDNNDINEDQSVVVGLTNSVQPKASHSPMVIDLSEERAQEQLNAQILNLSSSSSNDDDLSFVTAEGSISPSPAPVVNTIVNYKKRRQCSNSLQHHIPYNCLILTIKQIFHILKLNDLLGSKRNIRGFFRFLRKSIVLGGTKSSLHLGELMALINPKETPFFHALNSDKLATETMVAKFVCWLFTDYVLVLLKTSFYITECNDTRFHLKFFLRESWISSSHKMKSSLLQKGALTEWKGKLTQHQQKTKGIIRYIPKKNYKMRPVLIKEKAAWSITDGDNRRFTLLLQYIDSKINKSLKQLPSTFQTVWGKFLQEWSTMGSPKLYYLRMDIRDAYPSVSSGTLKNILYSLTGERESQQQQLFQKQYVVFSRSGKKLLKNSIFDKKDRSNWHSGIQSRPCLVMDLNRDSPINTADILDKLTTVITSSTTVRIGKKYYEFCYGLPQGWGLSSTLCSIFYGYVDSTLHLPYLAEEGRFFLRVVDDYLFITPEPNEIMNFMQVIKVGCDKVQVKMNEEKSETNIFVRSDKAASEGLCDGITFCGWNVCVVCGHISRDYTKYEGQNFCSTVSFQLPPNITTPEQFIRLRGAVIMPVRLKPILLDLRINCPRRILLTVYEAAVLLGYRFYALCKVIYPTMNAIKEKDRASHLIESIILCCKRLAKFVKQNCVNSSCITLKSKMHAPSCKIGACCAAGHVVLPLPDDKPKTEYNDLDLITYNVFLYTSVRGFTIKLKQHSVVFNDEVLPVLNSIVTKLGKTVGPQLQNHIVQIIGTKIPPYFQNISI